MASELSINCVGDAFDLVNGYAFKSADFIDSGVRVIKIKNIKAGAFSEHEFSYVDEKFLKLRGEKLAKQDDLLISMSGNRHDGSPETWVGKVAYFSKDETHLINQRVGALRLKPGARVLPRFAGYVLSAWDYQQHFIAVATSSGGQANLSPGQILGVPFSVPPLEEQHAIAETLGALDDRIANLRQTTATLQAIAAALFKSWFVDFDGVPQEDMQESELGLIPKGWRAYAFGEIATLGKGSVNPATQPQTVFQHYSLPAFDAGQMPIAETGQAIKSNKTPVPFDAVLVSKLNPHIPRIWFVGETGDSAVCSTEFLVWTPKPGIGSAFIYFVATSPEFNATMRQLVTGTSNSHQRVKPDQLASAHAAIASKESIAAFDEAIAPILKKIEHNRQQAATLATLRDTLLPRLISGRLRMGNAERASGEGME